MDFTNFRTYCSQQLQNKLNTLGFERRKEDVVEDETRILLEEAKYWAMRKLNAIYFQIWNNPKAVYDYQVTFTDSEMKLFGNDFNTSSDALEHALNAICDMNIKNNKQ